MTRNPVIDVYRGLAITLVVLGHVTGLPDLLFKLIYSFHMPAFFIVSGFLFNESDANRNMAGSIRKKFFRLVIPAWAMGLICGIPFLVFLVLGKRGITMDVFMDKLVGTLTGYPSVEHTFMCTPIWFLFCLFIVEFFAILASRAFPRTSPVILVFIGSSGLILSSYHSVRIPFDVHIAVSACFFFALGMLLKKLRMRCNPPTVLSMSLVLIMWSLVAYHSSGINMAANSLGSGIWLVFNLCAAIGGAYLLLGASRYVVQHGGRPSFFLAFLGMNSLPVIGFNYWINSISFQLLGELIHWSALFAVELTIIFALLYAIEKRGGKLGDVISGSWSPAFK